MKAISFSHQTTVTDQELKKYGAQLEPEMKRMHGALQSKEYKTPYAALYVPFDDQMLAQVKKHAQEKKKLNPAAVVVIGIGGSNLGTMAVHQALRGRFYNEQEHTPKLYFADTIDTDATYDLVLLLEQIFEKKEELFFIVISKSGTTLETIANFALFHELLLRYRKDGWQDFMTIITDKNSQLWNYAQKNNISCLEIPAIVGGRYSLFSPVGLFPLAMLGIDIDQLCQGARDITAACTSTDMHLNSAAAAASLLYSYAQRGYNIHDTFLFSLDLHALGLWYRQLMAESIGKEKNNKEEVVQVGITPTVSLGTIDLHSVAQLYLAGPEDKFTTFVYVQKTISNVIIPPFSLFKELVSEKPNMTYNQIMDAIFKAVQKSYHYKNRPFCTFYLPEKSAFYIGQLLQLYMIQIIYLGYLFEINPFDQPQVELYKKETKAILAYE